MSEQSQLQAKYFHKLSDLWEAANKPSVRDLTSFGLLHHPDDLEGSEAVIDLIHAIYQANIHRICSTNRSLAYLLFKGNSERFSPKNFDVAPFLPLASITGNLPSYCNLEKQALREASIRLLFIHSILGNPPSPQDLAFIHCKVLRFFYGEFQCRLTMQFKTSPQTFRNLHQTIFIDPRRN